ncbi:MAG: GNAT family N-acetyltransferase, partial [Dehalococcoidia bacterium]
RGWDWAAAGDAHARTIRHPSPSPRRRVWTLARWAWHGFRRAEPAILQPEIRGIIVEIYVEPAFRRRGIGKALLTEGCRWFEREHVMAVEAWIWAGNAASLGLFGSRGFQVSGQIVRRSLSSGS